MLYEVITLRAQLVNGQALATIARELELGDRLRVITSYSIHYTKLYELRTAITLREVDGLSYEEIAEAMQCPIGTVRSRIFRAREAIDEKLRPLSYNFV